LECHEASKHHLLEFGFFLDTINLGFLLRGNSLLYLSNLPFGVPNWTVIYIINTATTKIFLAPLPGNEEEEAPTSTTCQQNIKQQYYRLGRNGHILERTIKGPLLPPWAVASSHALFRALLTLKKLALISFPPMLTESF
jgi:hypothetical protein